MNEHTRDVVLFEVKENVTINIFAADIDSEVQSLNQPSVSLKLEPRV